MSRGTERDSGVYDRTINETSSEEEEGAARHNPLENIAKEGNENVQSRSPETLPLPMLLKTRSPSKSLGIRKTLHQMTTTTWQIMR